MEKRLKGSELKDALDTAAAFMLCYNCIKVFACLSPFALL